LPAGLFISCSRLDVLAPPVRCALPNAGVRLDPPYRQTHAVPQTFRDGAGIHGATPTAAPTGGKPITTQELVKLYKSEPGLVVLDSLQVAVAKKQTLPSANWLHGAGWAAEKFNTAIEKNFAKAMAAIAPSKDTPIVSYCENWECWLSWNTAMRLSVLGYTRIYWYRGGMDAWKAAKLPLVDTPITAQLW